MANLSLLLKELGSHLISRSARPDHALPVFFRQSPRFFSTEGEQPPPESPADPFLDTSRTTGSVYGKLSGIARNTTDNVKMLEGCNFLTMRQSQEGRALRQLTSGKGKSAGRNSSGRITAFHRGGGSKRLQRRIDLKRSTSSMGIVERIEYDPNRSSRIALVRWIEGDLPRKCNTIEEFAPPPKILEPTTTTIRGLFSFSSPPGKVNQRKVACFSPGRMAAYAVVGLPTRMPPSSKSHFSSTCNDAGSQKTCTKDVFFSAFSSQKTKEETAPLSFGSSFPRIAVAGAKPPFFSLRMRDKLGGKNTFSLNEVQKWRTHSILWAHRIKRKAALSWQSFR